MFFDLIIFTLKKCNFIGLHFMKICRSFIVYCEVKQMQEHLLRFGVATKLLSRLLQKHNVFQATSENLTYTWKTQHNTGDKC
jgi:hypothetical protein